MTQWDEFNYLSISTPTMAQEPVVDQGLLIIRESQSQIVKY
jgi:hypothetical protein